MPVGRLEINPLLLERSIRYAAERKQAEAEVFASRAMLEAALSSMTDAVVISDAAGNFLQFNDTFATFHRFRDKDGCLKL